MPTPPRPLTNQQTRPPRVPAGPATPAPEAPERTHTEQNANADAGHIGRRTPQEVERLVPPRRDRLPPPTS